jgi:hypothetical protein
LKKKAFVILDIFFYNKTRFKVANCRFKVANDKYFVRTKPSIHGPDIDRFTSLSFYSTISKEKQEEYCPTLSAPNPS